MAEADTNPVELPLETAGSRMRRAREAAGLSLTDIAARTKIPERSLVSIEAGDFAALPARTYAVGFSRSYARALGLDEKAIVESVRDELSGTESESDTRSASTFEPGDPARVPGGGVVLIAALAAVALLLGLLVVWRSYLSPAVTLPSLSPQESAAPAAAPSQAAGGTTAAPQAGGPVVFTALESGIWVKFYDGAGNQLLQKQLAQGETYTLPADAQDPKIWTGRPEALSITIGGQAVPKLSDRQMTMKDVPVSAAALLARGAPAPSAVPSPVVGAAAIIAPAQASMPQHRTIARHEARVATQPAPAPAPAVPAAVAASDAAQPQASTVTQ
ncbi:MAG: helix-turn-helix domain-containing protein [Sphingomonadales bacterium]|nr:helix-turn-helix domain-containing protein [Sphingomonadales bacterium]